MMKQFGLFFLIMFFTFSCGVKSNLSKDFRGKTLSSVNEYFSSLPSARMPMENGNTKVIYTKEEKLKGTTINQGTNTLDPINSPPVVKTEQFIFIVDQNETVIDTQYKSDYRRLKP